MPALPYTAMHMTVDSRIITILVGPEGQQKSFNVHQPLLEAWSENFVNALKADRWVEVVEGIIRFPDEDPEIFHLYLSFAYNANGVRSYTEDIIEADVPSDRAAFHELFDPQATKLAKVFVLAHMLLDEDMVMDVHEQIVELRDAKFFFDGKEQQAAFPVEGISALYDGLPDPDDVMFDPRAGLVAGYNTWGGSLDHEESKLSDNMKVLRESHEYMPPSFISALLFNLYWKRVDRYKVEDEKNAQAKEIKKLKARIAELENHR